MEGNDAGMQILFTKIWQFEDCDIQKQFWIVLWVPWNSHKMKIGMVRVLNLFLWKISIETVFHSTVWRPFETVENVVKSFFWAIYFTNDWLLRLVECGGTQFDNENLSLFLEKMAPKGHHFWWEWSDLSDF